MNAATAVQCVIIHHRSPTTVGRVVSGALASGIAPERIVVVDNSPLTDAPLTAPPGVSVIRTENHGYAAAANRGVRYLESQNAPAQFTIIASHEAEINAGAVAALAGTLESDSRIAAAGPTLYVEGTRDIWSTGGYLSRVLHIADHHRSPDQEGRVAVDREWLDGALVLYRSDALRLFPFDESYFLYFEETDLHVRLRGAGYRVVWVPRAVSHQTSKGIPPRLIGRNTMLFQNKHFTRTTGRLAVAVAAGKAGARRLVLRRGEWSDIRQIVTGWWEAETALRAGAQ